MTSGGAAAVDRFARFAPSGGRWRVARRQAAPCPNRVRSRAVLDPGHLDELPPALARLVEIRHELATGQRPVPAELWVATGQR